VTQSYQAKGTDDGAVLSLRPGERVSDVLFRMTASGVVTGRMTFVKSVRIGGDDILEKGLQLAKGSAGRTIEVVISSASAQLDGSVSDDDPPVAGAHVRVVPEPETPYNRVSGA
jgi:hypothetical protein